MGKSKANQTKVVSSALPIAPWVYVNDPSGKDVVATALTSLIPMAILIYEGTTNAASNITKITSPRYKEYPAVIASCHPEACDDAKQATANEYREAAIAHGCNFASVDLTYIDNHMIKSGWGTNHLDVSVGSLTTQEIAEKIYKWLFSVLTVPETIHLIPESEMKAIDKNWFPGYAYCPIVDCRKRPKDAKIQIVALITSKPTIGAGKKLHWTVADRTGVANFYFQWRGPESKYTWDWVLKLQPGDRKALPRMPAVQVKEKKSVAVAKAPFRAVGLVIGGTGLAIKSIGHGLHSIGTKVKMGSRSEWIPEADVVVKNGKKVKASSVVVDKGNKTEIKIFDEKGRKLWKDDDSDSGTLSCSTYAADEKLEKEFC